MICASCGQENPEGFGFCGRCGSPLATKTEQRRKPATLLFSDASGSTAMGERLDAESVRELMFSYFHEMRSAIERHGGTVEKFVGDAVMAVFGVPEAHEDDPLRACRAALEMQERLPELNQELERRYGSVLALRIGVNTGEVVTGDASTRETFVSGDAVNTAARLEQAAAPGEVLLGEATYRLVRDVVEAEPVEPITAKGKAEPVAAYRLLSVRLAPAPRPGRQTPLVGRTEELRTLEEMFARATAGGRLALATVIGEPGVGKSRLASEFVAALGGRARVLVGRCLAYGEGITWWPLVEIVRAAAGIHDEHDRAHALDRLDGLGLKPAATATLADLFGLGERPLGVKQIPWATRTLIESLAAEQPLLLLVEDLHWAEPALLDPLLDLAERVRAPALLLATARPELMQARPDWPGTVLLDILGEEETRVLLDATSLSGGDRDAALRACGGNPLFAEELASFLAERGAVEGELFHRGAVVALSDGGERAAVPAALDKLVDRDFARPAQAGFVDEAAFRFKHALVRDAAYEGTAKRLRAELHERFADWLEEKIGDRQAEVEEILGHHLERAYRHRAELAMLDERAAELARRAAERLARAGGRAGETSRGTTRTRRRPCHCSAGPPISWLPAAMRGPASCSTWPTRSWRSAG